VFKGLLSYYTKLVTISTWLVVIVASVVQVSAQQKTDTITKNETIHDVIVTGQYAESSISQSVYKVRLIDRKRIDLQGAVNLRDVLNNELNIRVVNDPALGGNVSIQGLSGQNVKILIDGVPVIGREGGFIDLNQLNLANIERIEIVEGPMSVNFGTDALGGVINLITKRNTGTKWRAGANTYYETIGQYNAGINLGFTKGAWTFDAQGSRNFFEGFSQNPNARFKQWKPRTQYFADAGITYKKNKHLLKYTLGYFDEKVTNRDSGVITPFFAYGHDQYLYSRRINNALFYTYTFKPHSQFNVVTSASFYRRVRNTVRKDLVSLEEQMVPSPLEHDTNYFSLWMSRGTYSNNNPLHKTHYQVGYEINHENGQGRRIENGMQTISDYNAFASAEFKHIKKVTLRPGIRVIYNTAYNAPIIPSLNVKYTPTSYLTLRASYGKGFRAPSLKELHLDFVDPSHNVQGNPNLNAETQNNYQTSATLEWSKFNHVFTVEPAFFYNDIRNKIDLVLQNASTLEARYENIGTFKNIGTNIATTYKAPRYSFTLGYAYTGIQNQLMQQQNTTPFFFTHELRANGSYEFKKPLFTLSVFYKRNGHMQNFVYDVNTGKITTGFISAFALLDVTLNKKFFDKKLVVTTGVKNVLDVTNIVASIPTGVHNTGTNAAAIAMGRSFFIALQYNLNFSK
jgi:outer membrane receptor for ferrienterochelin and colicins